LKKIKIKFLLVYFVVNFLNNQAFSSKISNKQILELSDKHVTLFFNHLQTVCNSNKFYENLNNTFEHKIGKPTEWKKKCLTLEENKSAKDFKKFHDLDVNELDGLAIMADTDNSKMKSISYFQNIYFSAD